MAITPLTAVISRQQSEQQLVDNINIFFGEIPTFITETNALAAEIETDAGVINGAIAQAETAATNSQNSATASAASATAAGISEDNAVAAAAAAGAAAGLPALVGNAFKPLRVNAAEDGVEFADLIAPSFSSSIKTDTATATTTSYVDTGLSVTITPVRASSKILLKADVSAGMSNNGNISFVFTDASNNILAQADTAGSRTRSHFSTTRVVTGQMMSLSGSVIVDSSNLSARTYKLRYTTNAGTIYLNRSSDDGDSSFSSRGVSTLFAMEIFQ